MKYDVKDHIKLKLKDIMIIIMNECSKQEQNETRHNWVGTEICWERINELKNLNQIKKKKGKLKFAETPRSPWREKVMTHA